MSPVAMRKIELYVLKDDIDEVLELLGKARCFQPAAPKKSGAEEPESGARTRSPASAAQLSTAAASPAAGRAEPGSTGRGPRGPARRGATELERLGDIGRLLGLAWPSLIPEGARLPGEAEAAALAELEARTADLVEEAATLAERETKIRDTLEEARAFSGLSLPFRELDRLSFLAVRIGRVAPSELPALRLRLGDRALLLPLDEEGGIVAAASKKGRFALDTELERSSFRPREFPPDYAGLPPELILSLEAELEGIAAAKRSLEERKAALATADGQGWAALSASYALAEAVEEVKAGLESSELVYRLEGWVPKERLASLSLEIGRLSSGRSALRSYSPEELPSVRSGREKVPVLLKRRAFVSSFERLVISYGAPLYGSIDPTPLVAFFFVLLFSLMFGDLGQGLVILVVGLFLRKGIPASLGKWKVFGPILVAVGLGSMVMGLLEGSFFTNEEFLVPLNRAITGFLFGRPMDRFLSLMPSGGIEKLFAFFGFTLAVGALMNSAGLVVNIVNKLRLGKPGEALFSKTGLAGAFFFWWALGLGVRIILGGGPHWIDIPGFLLPLLALFLEEPLSRLVEKGPAPAEKEGALGFAIKGLVEIIESISYYFSNTLSYLRVGAFALSHTVLSFIVFTMAELLRTRAPGGALWQILVLFIGNALILVLEGMIVTIQVIRLQYYEFFSKFFTETGVEFSPFRFEYRKE